MITIIRQATGANSTGINKPVQVLKPQYLFNIFYTARRITNPPATLQQRRSSLVTGTYQIQKILLKTEILH